MAMAIAGKRYRQRFFILKRCMRKDSPDMRRKRHPIYIKAVWYFLLVGGKRIIFGQTISHKSGKT
jgi:hypothetical protein